MSNFHGVVRLHSQPDFSPAPDILELAMLGLRNCLIGLIVMAVGVIVAAADFAAASPGAGYVFAQGAIIAGAMLVGWGMLQLIVAWTGLR
jgi:hypothetical protein